ncbi:MAG: exo-alpha-sialidase [Armatimonadetes bacterium]|nr:exo-alpha-sialidase [Armatimonadota bacterium]
MGPSSVVPFLSIVPQGTFNGYNSVQVNVNAQGQNIPNDAANEPSMTITPGGRRYMSVGWRQFNSVTSNFRQGGFGYSTNGGAAWTFPGVLEPGVFRSDPVLGIDPQNRHLYLSLRDTFFDDLWRSANAGANFSFVGPATGGDKQWMAVDTTGGIGNGNLYQAWSTAGNNWGGRQFSRSTNNGASWMNPINLPHQPVWGTLDVAPNGDLFVVGEGSSSFWFLRSQNAQNPSVTPTFNRQVAVSLGGQMAYGQYVNPSGLSGQTWVAYDKSSGLPTSGNLYMLCSVYRNSTNPCDVMFSRSTDGGATWSAPKRVNDDPPGTARYHWFGTMSVAPNGRIDVVWYDTRADSTNQQSALYYAYSLDGGNTFSPSVQVSGPFYSRIGWPQQNKLGDYIACLSDIGGANVAYAATFNGEQDVYYVRIPFAPRFDFGAFAAQKVEGGSQAGGVANTWSLDGSTYNVRGAYVSATQTLVASARLDFQVPADAKYDLWLTTALNVANQLTEEVHLYNWVLGRYDLLGTRALQRSKISVTFPLQGDPSPYVDASGKVRVWIRAIFPRASPRTVGTLFLDLARLKMN